MRKIAAFICVVLLLAIAGCDEKKTEENNMAYQQVTAEEAQEIMETEDDYVIVDVRTEEEYESGHIPDAICIPNEEIGDTEPEELPDKEQLILVYCRSGNRSKQAAGKLAALGYTSVVEFGGIQDWSGEIEE
ncbi:MAG: rhodanese-like domain-containing protein [Roseburia sp.]|nr:rhodanese-like domain-containing protein [Roseburia sp.]